MVHHAPVIQLALLLALLPGLPGSSPTGSTALHPDSLSRSRLIVAEGQALLELRFQALSLLEIRPQLDLDGDGELSQAECDRAREWLTDYVAGHWRLTDLEAQPEQAAALAQPRLLELRRAPESSADLPQDGPLSGQLGYGWIEARFALVGPKPLASFRIESRLFVEESPAHRDMASVVFEDQAEFFLPFQAGPYRYGFRPESSRRRGVLWSYFLLGYEHIKGGYDHLAFLLVLIVAVPRLRSLLGLVTAFTVAHSITLAATVLNAGGLSDALNSNLVEMGIALSIAYVACDNLIRRGARNAWPEAFLFGLLHGLGFAGFLGEALAGEPMVVSALLGFNLGVEGGQLLVVLAATVLLLGLRRLVPPAPVLEPATGSSESTAQEQPEPSFAPAWLRNSVSLAVALLGFLWFFQRTGWLA